MKKVSILMPCYCHENFVEGAVRSVMNQDYPNLELLIIDDGSKDRSPDILRELQNELGFTLICRENRGVVATLNELLSLSTGDYICDFASDDMFVPGRISKQVAYLDSHPETAVVCGLPSLIDNEGLPIEGGEKRYFRENQEITFEEIFCGNAEIHGATEMIRRDVLLKCGGWTQKFAIEDYALWTEILHRGHRIYQLNEPLSYYRMHDNNMSKKINLMYEQTLAIVDQYKDHPLYKTAVRQWKMRWFSTLSYHNRKEAVRLLPTLASPTIAFWIRATKLLIPKTILKRFGKNL